MLFDIRMADGSIKTFDSQSLLVLSGVSESMASRAAKIDFAGIKDPRDLYALGNVHEWCGVMAERGMKL
jgi:hypothetical protein